MSFNEVNDWVLRKMKKKMSQILLQQHIKNVIVTPTNALILQFWEFFIHQMILDILHLQDNLTLAVLLVELF